MTVWHERGKLDDLRPVLDPKDFRGDKNYFIDQIHKAALRQYFSIDPAHTVLDFGCGIGRFSGWLSERSRRVVGLEMTGEMLPIARERCPEANLRWVHYGGAILPFGGESFERILSGFVLQHVEGQAALRGLIAEFARVLKPGGLIGLIEQIHPQTRQVVAGYIEQRLPAEYIQEFETAGFEKIRALQVRVPARITTWAAKGRIPRPILKILAPLDMRQSRDRDASRIYADYLMVFRKI